MKSTPDDVLTALELIGARVPDRHVTPDSAMALSWHSDLDRFDRTVVFAAARSWNGLRFPAASEFVASCRELAVVVAAQEAARYASGELELRDCPEGCEHGYLFSKEDKGGCSYDVARPCERCRPVEYAIWRHRTANANHNPDRCADCIQIRTGKDPLPEWFVEARQARATTGARPGLDF